MACFSLAWVEQLLIWLVIVLVLFGIIKLLVPAIMGQLGAPPGGGVVVTILGYVMWGVVAIFCIILFFDLLSCAFGGAPLGTPFRFPAR